MSETDTDSRPRLIAASRFFWGVALGMTAFLAARWFEFTPFEARQAAPLAAAAALIGGAVGVSLRPGIFGPAFAIGVLAALGIASAGLLARVHVVLGVCGSIVAAALLMAVSPGGRGRAGWRWGNGLAARLAVAAALGLAGGLLLRGYVPVTRTAAHALSDLGLPFLLGLLVLASAFQARRDSRQPVLFAAAGCLAVALVAGYSFFFYPDLVISESAVLQTPPEQLVAGRVFPIWVLALGLAPVAWVVFGGDSARGATLAAAALGCGAVGLLPGSYRGLYTAVAALTVAAAIPCRRSEQGHEAGPVALGWVLVVLGAAGVAWCLLADPHAGMRGLRGTAAARAQGPFAIEESELTPRGLLVRMRSGDYRVRLVNGALVSESGRGHRDDPALRQTIALGLAFAGEARSIGVVAPSLPSTRERLSELAPRTLVDRVDPWRGGGGGFDLVVAGPGPTAAGDPRRLLSVQGLQGVATRMGEGGVFAMLLPAGNMSVHQLRRALATVERVFPDYCVFLSGRDMALLAGAVRELPYAGLKRIFGRMGSGGPRHPLDLVSGFAGDAQGLTPLVRGAAPYVLSEFERAPRCARNLAAPVSPGPLAAVAQYRLEGPGPLLNRLRFRGEATGQIALHGFAGGFADNTRQILSGMGQGSPRQQQEVLDFLRGPLVRGDLFASAEASGAVRSAAVLRGFGLHQAAAEVLRKALRTGQGEAEVTLMLARLYAGPLSRPGDAEQLAARVLKQDPGNRAAARLLDALGAGPGRGEPGASGAPHRRR